MQQPELVSAVRAALKEQQALASVYERGIELSRRSGDRRCQRLFESLKRAEAKCTERLRHELEWRQRPVAAKRTPPPPKDEVAEQSEQSFPASDPPSWTRVGI